MNDDEFRRAYTSLENKFSASERLKQRTKESLGFTVYKTDSPVTMHNARRVHGGMPTLRPCATAKSVVMKQGIVLAACVVFVIGVGLLAQPVVSRFVESTTTSNTFNLVAYADEDRGTSEQIAISIDDFYPTRTNVGYRYDEESNTTDMSTVVAERYYNLNLTCTGKNIKSITYRIGGSDVSFGDWTTPENNVSLEIRNGFEFSVEYDSQNPDDLNRELSLRYELNFEDKLTFDSLVEQSHDSAEAEEASRRIETLLARCDASEFLGTKLTLIAEFRDGTKQTKVYSIVPCDNFESNYRAYIDSKRDFALGTTQPVPPLFMLVSE